MNLNEIRKINHHPHQLLTAGDLQDEQEYHTLMNRLSAGLLYGQGVLSGFDSSLLSGPDRIRVASGVALIALDDERSRMVRTVSEIEVSFDPALLTDTSKEIRLVLMVQEDQLTEPAYIIETAELRLLSPDEVMPEEALPLVRVKKDQSDLLYLETVFERINLNSARVETEELEFHEPGAMETDRKTAPFTPLDVIARITATGDETVRRISLDAAHLKTGGPGGADALLTVNGSLDVEAVGDVDAKLDVTGTLENVGELLFKDGPQKGDLTLEDVKDSILYDHVYTPTGDGAQDPVNLEALLDANVSIFITAGTLKLSRSIQLGDVNRLRLHGHRDLKVESEAAGADYVFQCTSSISLEITGMNIEDGALGLLEMTDAAATHTGLSLKNNTRRNPNLNDATVARSLLKALPGAILEDMQVLGNHWEGISIADEHWISLNGTSLKHIEIKDNDFRIHLHDVSGQYLSGTHVVSMDDATFLENIRISGNHARGFSRFLSLENAPDGSIDVYVEDNHIVFVSFSPSAQDECIFIKPLSAVSFKGLLILKNRIEALGTLVPGSSVILLNGVTHFSISSNELITIGDRPAFLITGGEFSLVTTNIIKGAIGTTGTAVVLANQIIT